MNGQNYVIILPDGEKLNLGYMDGWELFFKDVLAHYSGESKEILKENIIAAIKYTK